ncbi:MAG: Dyp-type peroxidase [Deltaproteobacteria bacterium]|jgi:putative iron-dependent peroxidase|nr:Dyp-type peroxidase [Deltaproteobacteria bacterium]
MDVTASPGQSAIFIIFGLPDRQKAREPVKALCGKLPALARSLKNRFPKLGISAVMGFGAEAWQGLFPGRPTPKELTPFQEIRGERHVAVSTPGDLFFHLRGGRMDVLVELASQISADLAEVVEPIDETHGFRYMDSRAIIGFVDGTENPEPEAAQAAAVIGSEDPQFVGGSYAMTQKYLHDLAAWNELPVEEQEKAIGRRKYDDRELEEGVKPENAHNAVTNISDPDGRELKIVRANVAFANPAKGEHGTYFIGYAATFSTTKRMLENMFVGDPPGNTDRLLDFSRAISGTLFFVPSWDLLAELAEE